MYGDKVASAGGVWEENPNADMEAEQVDFREQDQVWAGHSECIW